METIVNTQKKFEHIHFETLDWKSALQFIDDEVHFIHQLVSSYSFEPNTPNLFESLQKFKKQISEIKKEIKNLQNIISKHEGNLGGILECSAIATDTFYHQEHEKLKRIIEKFYVEYRSFKSEVFKYAGGILKSKKKN